MRSIKFAQTQRLCLLQLLLCLTAGSEVRAQSLPVSETSAVATLSADVESMISEFAVQRDRLGGWPARVQEGYDALVQLKAQFDAARAASDTALARKRYQQLMRVAVRISRWLAIQYSPTNEQLSSRDQVEMIVSRFQARLDLLRAVAIQQGVALDLSGVNAAKMRVQSARASGTDAQLRAAVRTLRDEIDALQDMVSGTAG